MRMVPFEKSFASSEKSKYWSNKNGIVKPENVYKSAGTKYWFDCENCNHSFETQLNCVKSGVWCPYCCLPPQKLCDDNNCQPCFDKSFASHEKSNHLSKLHNINPRQLLKQSNKKYWFDCHKCNHSFETPLNAINRGVWCPYCCLSPQKLCYDNNCQPCFDNSFASSEKSKYWSNKNGHINPRSVFKSSGSKYWFDCDNCNHSFESSLDQVTRGRWCSYCSHTILCHDTKCNLCFDNSFASSEKSKYWSNKNGCIKPRGVFKSTGKQYYFDCHKCNHSFDIKLNAVNRGTWCSYCCLPPQKLCDDDNCQHCYDNSFDSNEKSKYWSNKNGNIKPRGVFNSTHVKYWFDCDKCNHSFETPLNAINRGTWCPYCSTSSKMLCNNNECQHCFDKSFASSEKCKYWSNKNGSITPRCVFKSSHIKYWFDCDKCNNLFESSLGHVTNSGTWCPWCVNKTEGKLNQILILKYPSLITQFKQDWCKSIRNLPFDFCIPEYKIIIELDGRQHFQQVRNWSNPEEQQYNDKFKEKCANDNGYSVIRLLQEDVYNDTYDWFNELSEKIQLILNSNSIQNIYLCKNNQYTKYVNTNQ